jgi:thiosulfate/3-mercaptopyruvate sulfurtransferase
MSTSDVLAEPFIVEPDWIAEQLDDPTVRLIEVDVSRAAYGQGHIPGAALWNAYVDLRHPDYTPIGADELGRLLSASGVTAETTVVFYGYGAHLGYWLLKSYGHERVRLMDGPREQWLEAGYGWSVEAPTFAPTWYVAAGAGRALGSSREAVQALVGESGPLILDVRSRAEYDGERFWPSGATEDAGRAGHIPGSMHLPIEKLRTEDGRFREQDELQALLRDHGVTPGCRVVLYCTIGNRASQAWFALTHLLDHADAEVYYGSWAEWGTSQDTAVER